MTTKIKIGIVGSRAYTNKQKVKDTRHKQTNRQTKTITTVERNHLYLPHQSLYNLIHD